MTKEEYMAQTAIKSPDEARGYLRTLRIIQVCTFIAAGIAILSQNDFIDESVRVFFILPVVILGIYGELYITKLVKKLKLGKLLTFDYALKSPYSLYGWRVYTEVREALEIIIGIKQAPASLKPEVHSTPSEQAAQNFLSRLSKPVWIAVFITAILLIFFFVFQDIGII